MCMVVHLRIKKIFGATVLMEDDREVRLGNVKNVTVGDYLEVYANLAFAKIEKSEAKIVSAVRQKAIRGYVS